MVDTLAIASPEPIAETRPVATAAAPAPDAQQALVRHVYLEAFHAVQRGASAAAAATQLTSLGLDPETATTVVTRVQRFVRELRAAYVANGLKAAGIGALWCVGGSAVTAVTYAAAANGGTYVVAWGAVVFGGLQVIRGLFHATKRATQQQFIEAFGL